MALRSLGLSLAQVGRVLDGDLRDLEEGLAAHEASLNAEARRISAILDRVQRLRADLTRGEMPLGSLSVILADEASQTVSFPLPWPWNGELFVLRDVPKITFITGPLGSGKTRFAMRLAEELSGAEFLGLDRLSNPNWSLPFVDDPEVGARVSRRMAWLIEDGAEESHALHSLILGMEAGNSKALVVDMVEEGLSANTQVALMSHLRLHGLVGRALFLMTRSSAILDLDALDPGEQVIFCPANHAPAFHITPYPGGRGYEAVETCVASPEVRARTVGVVAKREGLSL